MKLARLVQCWAKRLVGAEPRAGAPPGLYEYTREVQGWPTRFHLRVDRDGTGVLVANATAAARLTASGTVIAQALLAGESDELIARRLRGQFRGTAQEVLQADIARIGQLIDTLASPGDNYPILNLAGPALAGRSNLLDRPLCADVPLADLARLRPILDRLWESGIPHVTFIAGEAPDPTALVRAVEAAEDLGMIAGVRGRATGLARGQLLHDLALAGIDHVDILYLAHLAEVHDALAGAGDHQWAQQALRQLQEEEVCAVAEMVLVPATVATVEATLRDLVARDVHNACFWALACTEAEARSESGHDALAADALVPVARLIEELGDQWQVRFVWYAPVRFTPGRPLAEQIVRGPRASGDHAVRVEPDGSVLLARGPYCPAGNLLTDDWDTIQQSAVYQQYRRRIEADTHCPDCPGLAICAADCPREPAGWAEPAT